MSGAEGVGVGCAGSIISSRAARLASLLQRRSLALYHRLLLSPPASFTLRTEPRPDALRIRTGFTESLQLGTHLPQGLKPAFFHVLNGTAEEAAEERNFRRSAPKGAMDGEGVAVSLKR